MDRLLSWRTASSLLPALSAPIRAVLGMAQAAVLAVTLAVTLAFGLPLQAEAEPLTFHSHFKAASLRDQANRPVSPARLRGRIALVNFVYTGCTTVCPVQTQALKTVWQALPPSVQRDTLFVSVSVDPLSDTPAILKQYAERFGLDPRWLLVTGSRGDIDQISQDLSLFDKRKKLPTLQDHSTGLWLVTGEGLVLQRYRGDPVDVKRMVAEITQLHGLPPHKP